VPCKFAFSIGNEKEAAKPEAMDALSINNTDVVLATDNQVKVQDTKLLVIQLQVVKLLKFKVELLMIKLLRSKM